MMGIFFYFKIDSFPWLYFFEFRPKTCQKFHSQDAIESVKPLIL